jgi:Tfp pilus assembly protein PilF
MRPLAPLLLVLVPALVSAQSASTSTSSAPAAGAVAPSSLPQAAFDKLGEGDRYYLAGDYRNALFSYQDATYIAPRHAPARVRLGRAYLALRYPDKAIDQAELAIAEDPEAPDARKLLEEARAQAESGGGAIASPLPAAAATPAPTRAGPKTYKLTPEEAKPATAPRALTAAAVAAPAPTPAPAGDPEAAAAHYRTAIGLLQNRDWKEAANELTTAIRYDPKLAVAYSARGSALFGLGRYGDAADDYQRSVSLDANLATPLYGLAECYRVLGDNKKAAEAYEKYAKSTASDVREDLRATASKRAQELK